MNYISNKYSKIYFKIIKNAQHHPRQDYVESHHIEPKSLGGQDKKDNLVNLTAKEHFICHLLLTKMFSLGSSEYYKMIKAFGCMLWRSGDNQERYKVSGKAYAKLREEFSIAMSTSQKNKRNSQYGTMWIHNANTQENKKIKKDSEIPNGWKKGRVLCWKKYKREENRAKELEAKGFVTHRDHLGFTRIIKKETKCSECGDSFKTKRGKFCSLKCKNKNYYKSSKKK